MGRITLISRKNKQSITGVDITSSAIKLVEMSRVGSNIKVTNLGVSYFDGGVFADGVILNKEGFKAAVQDCVQSTKLSEKNVAYALTGAGQTIVKTAIYPATHDDEVVAKAIATTSGKESSFDFKKTGETRGANTEYSVCLVKNKALNERNVFLEAAGLTPKVVSSETEAMACFVREFNIGNAHSSCFAVYSLGDSSSSLYIFVYGKLVHETTLDMSVDRLLNTVKNHFYGKEIDSLEGVIENPDYSQDYEETLLPQFVQDICNELHRELRAFQSGINAVEVEELYVTGNIKQFRNLLPRIAEDLQIKTQKLSYLDSGRLLFASSQHRDFFEQNEQMMLMPIAYGLLGLTPGVLNVMPWREAEKEQRKKSYITGAAIAGLLGAGLVYGAMTYAGTIANEHAAANDLINQHSAKIDAELAKTGELQKNRQTMLSKMKLIKDLQTDRADTVKVVNAIAQAVPQNAFLTKIEAAGDLITIEGMADNTDTIVTLMRDLKSSQSFQGIFMSKFVKRPEDAQPISPQEREARGVIPEDDYAQFTVTMRLVDESAITPTAAVPATEEIAQPQVATPIAEPVAAQQVQVTQPQVAQPAPTSDEAGKTLTGSFQGVQ